MRLTSHTTLTTFFALTLVGISSLHAQTVFTYAGGNGGSWIRNTNWTGGGTNITPGVDANTSSLTDGSTTDIASFSTSATVLSVGINFNTSASSGIGANSGANGSLSLGALTFSTGGTSGNFLIGNNSTTLNGVLTLNGVTVGGNANTILANSSANTLTLANVQGSGNKLMGVALGNATDNKIYINSTGGITLSSIISGASKQLTKEGSGAGVLTLSGANTYSGGTFVNAGTLTAATSTSAFGTGNITIASGATLNLGGLAITNTIINNGGTLTGAASYIPTTPQSVTAVTTYSGTVGGAVNVSSSGTLKGTATFTGAVTIDGIHAPGNSPGIETFAAGLSYGASSILEWEFVGDTLAIRGTDFDGVDVTGGALSITAGASLKLIGTFLDYTATAWDSSRTFTVVDNSGSGLTSGNFTLDTSAAGAFLSQGGWSVATSSGAGGDTILTWTPVPEPSTYAVLAGLAVLGLAALRRRKS